jgi:succinate-acetate transporter protein
VVVLTGHPDEVGTRVVLRPVASPMSLGFLALGGATLVLAGSQLGWFDPQGSQAVALALMVFAFPLQFLCSIFGFLSRDGTAAAAMGILSASWLSSGLLTYLSPTGATSAPLGVLLIFAGAALVVPALGAALGAALGKLVPAAVLFTATLRFVLTGVHELTASPGMRTAAGIVGLILALLAWYAALALELEDVRRRTVLPILRVGMGRTALRGSTEEQVAGVEHEAGVREQL